MDFTKQVEKWIECEQCESWFHFVCVGLITEPDVFICEDCKE